MGTLQPWIDTAYFLVRQSREEQRPVLLDQAVKAIKQQHPDCALSEVALADIVRQTVIEERWSLASA